jgi:hypothetical protein
MSDADPYLGWIQITADDAESFVGWTDGFYSVREISPKKASYPVLPADAKGPLKVWSSLSLSRMKSMEVSTVRTRGFLCVQWNCGRK